MTIENVNYRGTGTVRADDGKLEHTFSQSLLKEVMLCGERARRSLLQEVGSDTDASAAGTGVHLGIELAILSLMEDNVSLTLSQVVDQAIAEFDEIMALPTSRWVQKKARGCHLFIERALALFYSDVLPTLDPLEVEWKFRGLPIYEDDKRRILLSGTVDCVDRNLGLLDWKTAGRPYEKWEKDRWDIQSAVYTWAYHGQGGAKKEFPFTFVIFLKGGEVKLQQLTVERGPGHWAWIEKLCKNTALLIEADLPQWPLNDSHALCSAKWCEFYNNGCKGSVISGEDMQYLQIGKSNGGISLAL